MMQERDADLTQEVKGLVETMYASYLRGDRDAIDALLSPQLTMFDSASPELIDGMAELQKVRDARPGSDGSTPARIETALTADRFTVRELDSTVVATWWLTIDAEAASGAPMTPSIVRNSAVLVRNTDGNLVIEHIHEDVLQEFGASAERDNAFQ